MSDLKPMLGGEADELEALLLRSADDDEPARGSLEKAGATLGVSATLLASAASGAIAHAALAPAGAVAKPLTLLSLAPWLAVGLGVGCVVMGGAHFAFVPAPAARPPALAGSTAPRPMRQAEPVAPAMPAAAPAPREDAAPNAEEPVPNKAPAAIAATPPSAPPAAAQVSVLPGPSSASFAPLEQPRAADTTPPISEPSAVPASTLGEETRALDRVRADIAAGQASQALEELAQYAAKWPNGALAMEAALLRVEALLRSGNRAEAGREADALIARAPRSLYATRARKLLGATPDSH